MVAASPYQLPSGVRRVKQGQRRKALRALKGLQIVAESARLGHDSARKASGL